MLGIARKMSDRRKSTCRPQCQRGGPSELLDTLQSKSRKIVYSFGPDTSIYFQKWMSLSKTNKSNIYKHNKIITNLSGYRCLLSHIFNFGDFS